VQNNVGHSKYSGNDRNFIEGTISVRWFFAHSILSIIHVVQIFTELGQDLAHLAHKKNTQSESFLWGRLRIKIAFCSLRP
jgi:hypothetical protein